MNCSPGYCEILWITDVKYFRQIADFIGTLSGDCVDIGVKNAKCEYLKDHFKIPIRQYITGDLNFDYMAGVYDNIFLFETLEHLQNPLFCMGQLKNCLKENGSIWVIMSAKPRFMWYKQHYFEIPPTRLQEWILAPLGLKTVRKQKLYPSHSMGYYLTGFKSFMRLFFNATWIYEIRHESK